MKRLLVVFAFVAASTAHAGTAPISLETTRLDDLFPAGDDDTRLNEAFFRLRRASEAAHFPLERWFKPKHYIYVRERLDPAHRVPLTETFRVIRERVERGETDHVTVLSEAPFPEIVAEVAAIELKVNQLKDLHKVAIRLALAKHEIEGKQRYGEERYSYHLRAVRSVLKRFGYGPKDSFLGLQLGTAAWLHDILEDTNLSRQWLYTLVGREIGQMVWGVTKSVAEPGESSESVKLRTFRKTARLKGSRILKLADRIANVEEGILRLMLGGPTKVHKYIEDWPRFQRYLRKPGEAEAMWTHLERLLTDRAYAQNFATRHLAGCARHLAR